MDSCNLNQQIYEENWKHVSHFKVTSPGNRWMFDLFDEIMNEIKSDSVHSVLDVGCGEGSKTLYLNQKYPNAKTLGIDFTETGIGAAKKRESKNLRFVCVDANDETVWREPYDLIFCAEVLEHVDEWKGLVDKFAMNARKYILLTFPVGKMRKYEISDGHVRNFKRGEIEEYLSHRHFRPVKVFYAGFPLYGPIMRDLLNIKSLFKFYDKKVRQSNKPTAVTILYSNVFYFLFKYCTTKYRFGDQFVGLFAKVEEGGPRSR